MSSPVSVTESMQHSTAAQECPSWTALPEANEESNTNNSESGNSLLRNPSPISAQQSLPPPPLPQQQQQQPSISPSSRPVRLTHSDLRERSMFYIRQSTRGAFDSNAHSAVQTSVRTRSPIASSAKLNADSNADGVRSADEATSFGPLSAGSPSSLGSLASARAPYVLLQPGGRSIAPASLDGGRLSAVERGSSPYPRSLSARLKLKERAVDKDGAAERDFVSGINEATANNTNERGRSRGPAVLFGPTQIGHPVSVRDGEVRTESTSLQPASAQTEEAAAHGNATNRSVWGERTLYAGSIEQPLPAQMQSTGPQTQGTGGTMSALNSTFAQDSRPATPDTRVQDEDAKPLFVDEGLIEFAEALQRTQRTTNPNIPRPPRTTNNSIIAALTANLEQLSPRFKGTLKRDRPDTDEDDNEPEIHEHKKQRKRVHTDSTNNTPFMQMTTRARNGVLAGAPSRFQQDASASYLHPLDRAYPSRVLDISTNPHLSTLLGYSRFTDKPDPSASSTEPILPRFALPLPLHQQHAQHPWSGLTTPRWSEAGVFKLRLDALFGEGSMLRGFGKRPGHEGGAEAEQPGADEHRLRSGSARESPAFVVDDMAAAGVSGEMGMNERMQAMRLGVPTTPTATGREIFKVDTDTEDAASTAAGTEEAVSEMRSRVMRRSLQIESPTRSRA